MVSQTVITQMPYRVFDYPVKSVYWILGTVSSLTHLGVVSYALFSKESDLTFLDLYLPNHTAVQRGASDILTAGALLFLQWDFLIIVGTVVCYGLGILHHLQGYISFKSLICLLGVVLILGPGAGLASILLWAESRHDRGPSHMHRTTKGHKQL